MVTKRKIEKLNIETSLLGFGCMRFPTKDGKIDEERAEKMLDEAIANGVNYIDTAYPYHNGESEPFTGRVLDKYPRDSYYLATKLPCWHVNTLDDAKRIFEEQLTRLNKTYVDFYLLHALNIGSWEKMRDLGVVEYCLELKKQGKIKFLGFSFHDAYEVFDEIIHYRDWDFCQIQLNYMDTEDQAGMKGYKLAEELNIPLTIMEPIKGGRIAVLPDAVTEKFRQLRPNASASSWALRWVASLPNILSVLSGMSNEEQVRDNISTFTNFEPMTAEENKAVEETAEIIKNRVYNGCTWCKYCLPCPAGVDIPKNFNIWNNYAMYENKGSTNWQWSHEIEDSQKAKNCLGCGQCESACPQKLPIREQLAALQKQLDELAE